MSITVNAIYQRGLNLVELLIGMTVGLIVVGMVLSVYLTTLDTSGDTLKSGRLNQEMAAIMNIMINDIRRAGFANVDGTDWDGGGTDDSHNLLEPSTNPFNQINTTNNTLTTALRGHQYTGGSWVDRTDVNTAANAISLCYNKDPTVDEAVCGCIVYGYDFDNNDTATINGEIDNDEFYGFRYDAGTKSVLMRIAHDYDGGDAPNSCTSGDWANMNDESSIEVTKLTFDLSGSACVNSAEPDGNGADTIAEANCYITTPAAGARTVERTDVLITLEARLKEDTNVKARMVQQVSVRNDRVRER